MERLRHDGKPHIQNWVYHKNRTHFSVMAISKTTVLETFPATTKLFTHPTFFLHYFLILRLRRIQNRLRSFAQLLRFQFLPDLLSLSAFYLSFYPVVPLKLQLPHPFETRTYQSPQKGDLITAYKILRLAVNKCMQIRFLNSDWLGNNDSSPSMSPGNTALTSSRIGIIKLAIKQLRKSNIEIIRYSNKLDNMSQSTASSYNQSSIDKLFYFAWIDWY